ncbi:MAG: exonuclease SbcCD subunit D C-terminal domain-containing protein [Methanoregula sp.]|uniref:exonuclease SbcCD subunit D C-terminal domain-containing protein n=1 Tax=Methanoregula sp. TaxID=2052170 RepID=UPI0025D29649|nr:exonuclease SbcCD subunit D C-terminal domain-containing protein [Methanoregula sp.]MCK9632597.1 exonuclease SbcCD subunit D C-terminal domain-containing protein [Methanoregula sp.]
MKILHSSDWHLGSSLYGHKRHEEFEAFLIWLARLIQTEQIDVLLVAGDIFDTSTPSNRTQGLYYQFLNIVTAIPGLQVIITAGNHDSPSLINAPQELLKHLHIHVFGSIPDNPEDEILVIDDDKDQPSLIVCAVPYLRDRDIRLSEPGESIEDKTQKLEKGVQEHYLQVVGIAKAKRDELGGQIPIVAMGHLFVSGGKTVDDDGVRELYVGNLARIKAENLCDGIDYLALGHLHVPQIISGKDSMRYCGSPIALGFGDAGEQKQVVIIDFESGSRIIRTISVPKFQDIRTLKGDIRSVENEIRSLIKLDHNVWIEVLFSGTHSASTVQAQLRELTDGTNVVLIRTKPLDVGNYEFKSEEESESLEVLSEMDVFQRCIDAENLPIEDRQELMDAFLEILHEMNEEDTLAE